MKNSIHGFILTALILVSFKVFAGNLAPEAVANKVVANGSCTNNGDGTLTTLDGTVWQLCAFGEVYKEGECSGAPTFLDWPDAMRAAKKNDFLGKKDWYIPSDMEFYQLIEDHKCVHPHIHRRLERAYMPSYFNNQRRVSKIEEKHWTSTTEVNGVLLLSQYIDNGWQDMLHTYAFDARVNSFQDREDRNIFTLLARNGNGAVDFAKSFENESLVKRMAVEIAAKKRTDEAREAAEQKVQAARLQEEERAFKAVLSSNDAQKMYLAAGRYQRAGERGRASQIYEAIITRFSTTQWAVKANDQLTADNQNSVIENADRNARGMAACFSDVRSCEAKCRDWGGSASSVNFCIRDCQKNCG